MATGRANLKWNRSSGNKDGTSKGVKPLPDPMSVQQMMVVMVMHVCRRILLRETLWRIAIYGAVILCGSLIADNVPIPRSYLSQKTNVFNVYFVKFGWGWTLVVVGSFVALTSAVYCCGERNKVIAHLGRLAVATVFWMVCTTLFEHVEAATRVCVSADYTDKKDCLAKGFRWQSGFDISGHTFILVYCSLIMSEEAKCIRGWARIADLIRNREFDDDSPLQVLSAAQLENLQNLYILLGRYVKCAFVTMTALNLLWDFMLLCTVMYFHTTPQKVAGALFAFAAWFVTYQLVFPNSDVLGIPGQGLFKYYTEDSVGSLKMRAQYARRPLSQIRQQRILQNGLFDRQSN